MDPNEHVGDTSYRAACENTLHLVAICVTPTVHTGVAMKHFRGCLFVHRGVRTVVDGPSDEDKKFLLLSMSNLSPSAAGVVVSADGKSCNESTFSDDLQHRLHAVRLEVPEIQMVEQVFDDAFKKSGLWPKELLIPKDDPVEGVLRQLAGKFKIQVKVLPEPQLAPLLKNLRDRFAQFVARDRPQ